MQKSTTHYWLLVSALVFIIHFGVGLLLVMLLNGNIVNYVLTPIFQYIGIFKLIWPEQPLGALQFLSTKSILAFAHQDPRSGLNLWTLEYDTITLLIFATLSFSYGWILIKYFTLKPQMKPVFIIFGIIGTLLSAFSVSYMTDIEHCSGATWVGFVALYGMGFDEFELSPIYQWICAVIGITVLGASLIATKRVTTNV